jgi:hypothetical protein
MLSLWREGLIMSVMPAVPRRAEKGNSYPFHMGRILRIRDSREKELSGPNFRLLTKIE